MTHEELQSINIKTGEQSTVTISGEIPFAYLEKHRKAAVTHIGKNVQLDGFRKGHIPEKILIERVGEMAILTEMAERALSNAYPDIIKEYKLDVVGHPQISIAKLAKNNPLGFKAIVAIMPNITLPDYKAIAKIKNIDKESDEVTDIEVTEQINDLLRQKIAYERLQEKASKKSDSDSKDTEGTTTLPTPESEAAKKATEKDINPTDISLPKLTDEYVKTLGQPGQFENVDDFKKKIREHLEIQKKQDTIAKHRAAITDEIVEKATIDLPQIMIDAEINQMFGQMEDDLKRAELKLDDYLVHIKKTKEDLITEWRPAAEKRAKLQLILNEIAKKEDINPDAGKVDEHVSQLLEQHKDADEMNVRIYVESTFKNNAVMELLEKQ